MKDGLLKDLAVPRLPGMQIAVKVHQILEWRHSQARIHSTYSLMHDSLPFETIEEVEKTIPRKFHTAYCTRVFMAMHYVC